MYLRNARKLLLPSMAALTLANRAVQSDIAWAQEVHADYSTDHSTHTTNNDYSSDQSQQTVIDVHEGGSIYRYEMVAPDTQLGDDIIVVNGQIYRKTDTEDDAKTPTDATDEATTQRMKIQEEKKRIVVATEIIIATSIIWLPGLILLIIALF